MLHLQAPRLVSELSHCKPDGLHEWQGLEETSPHDGGNGAHGHLRSRIRCRTVQSASEQASTVPAIDRSHDAAEQQAPAPRFRSSVDLVSVAAVVRDRKGRFVKDLVQEGFRDRRGRRAPADSRLPRRAERAGQARPCSSTSAAACGSGSGPWMRKAAAQHVFFSLSGRDQAAVFSFDTMLSEAQTFTSDRERAQQALDNASRSRSARPRSTTRSRRPREWSRPRRAAAAAVLPQRSAVVVITDGVDTRSRMKPSEVSMAASGIDVPVYILAVVATVDDPRENPEDQRAAAAGVGSAGARARDRRRAVHQQRPRARERGGARRWSASCATSTCSRSKRQLEPAGGRWKSARARRQPDVVRARSGLQRREPSSDRRTEGRRRQTSDQQRPGGIAGVNMTEAMMKKARVGRSGPGARAQRHHRMRDEEIRQDERRRSERQGRHALEVRSKRTRSGRAPTKAQIGEVDQRVAAGRSEGGRRPAARRRGVFRGRSRQHPRRRNREGVARLVYEVVLSEDKGNFKFGKAVMPDEAKTELDTLVQQLKAEPKGAYIEIEGHTDSAGTPDTQLPARPRARREREALSLRAAPGAAPPDQRHQLRRRQADRAEQDAGRPRAEPPRRHQGAHLIASTTTGARLGRVPVHAAEPHPPVGGSAGVDFVRSLAAGAVDRERNVSRLVGLVR